MSVTPHDDALPDAELALGIAATADSQGEGAGEVEPAACLNCGNARSGRYCSTCGQKAMPSAPTLGYFVREATHELTNVDGKIFRSWRLLLTRPGFLTLEIFAGKRASYVSPIRLYLLASVLAFGLRALLGADDYADFQYTAEPGEVTDPAMLERVAEAERTMNTAVAVWLPRAMFVLVPLFAALVMLFRRHGGYTYPQHLYFALHLHAVWFFVNAAEALFGLVTLPFVPVAANVGLTLYFLAYYFLAFRRVYETTILGTLWRTAAIGVLYMVLLIATVAAIAAPTAWSLMFGRST
jgi:hypothetical protein